MKDMKAVKIEGIKDLLLFAVFVLFTLTLIISIPTAFVWVAWNGIVGDLIHGPYIAFWQAIILTMALFIMFYLVARPEIHFEIKRVDGDPDLR